MNKIKVKNIRVAIQMIILSIVIVAATNHYLATIDKEITWISESLFHYICPICGVTSIYQFFISSSLWVVKLKSTLGIIIGLSIISAVLFGPIICGFICPFGAIQDLLSRVGKKIFKRKYNTFVSKKIDDKLKYLRYIVLVLTLILTATSSIILLEALNPYHAFLSIFNRKFSALGFIGFLILAIVIITSLFIQRPWCKYLCPYGAFLGLFNKIKVFRVVRNRETCVACKRCSKECPMSIDVHKPQEVRELSCISCMECVGEKVCPKNSTIAFTSRDFEEECNISINNKN